MKVYDKKIDSSCLFFLSGTFFDILWSALGIRYLESTKYNVPSTKKLDPSAPQFLCGLAPCLPTGRLCSFARVKNPPRRTRNSAGRANRVFLCPTGSRCNVVKSGSPGGTLERIRIVQWTILARGEMARCQK